MLWPYLFGKEWSCPYHVEFLVFAKYHIFPFFSFTLFCVYCLVWRFFLFLWLLLFCSTRYWTQGLVLTRQVLTLSSFCFSLFSERFSSFTLACLRLSSSCTWDCRHTPPHLTALWFLNHAYSTSGSMFKFEDISFWRLGSWYGCWCAIFQLLLTEHSSLPSGKRLVLAFRQALESHTFQSRCLPLFRYREEMTGLLLVLHIQQNHSFF